MTTILPQHMIAAVLTGHGGLETLELRHDWPVPRPAAGEALIRVAACSINNTDINTRIGWYDDSVTGATLDDASGVADKPEAELAAGWGGALSLPRIQGADVVGQVIALGVGVADTWLDARVIADPWLRDANAPQDPERCGYIGSECDGGFAQYVALPVTNLTRAPGTWSDVELATIPCAYTSAENMLTRARVRAGETVLVTGASGGVGSALIQLAKRRQASVIALTSAAKAEQVLALGADAVIRRDVDAWGPVIQAATRAGEIDVAADVVGGPAFAQLLSFMRNGGRYVMAGAIAGKMVPLDLSHMYRNDWTLMGTNVTSADVFPNLMGYIERGEIQPIVSRTYPLAEIHQAQRDFSAKTHVGKIVLVPPS